MRCPVHHRRLVLEDTCADYGHVLYVCPERDCRETHRTGPSEAEILRREHPGPRSHVARVGADPWRFA